VIFFSFISARSSCRYYPTQIAAQSANDSDLYVIEKSEDDITLLTTAVGPMYDCRSVKNETHFVEVDVPFAESLVTFSGVPTK
jgi:hypothetical protein